MCLHTDRRAAGQAPRQLAVLRRHGSPHAGSCRRLEITVVRQPPNSLTIFLDAGTRARGTYTTGTVNSAPPDVPKVHQIAHICTYILKKVPVGNTHKPPKLGSPSQTSPLSDRPSSHFFTASAAAGGNGYERCCCSCCCWGWGSFKVLKLLHFSTDRN